MEYSTTENMEARHGFHGGHSPIMAWKVLPREQNRGRMDTAVDGPPYSVQIINENSI